MSNVPASQFHCLFKLLLIHSSLDRLRLQRKRKTRSRRNVQRWSQTKCGFWSGRSWKTNVFALVRQTTGILLRPAQRTIKTSTCKKTSVRFVTGSHTHTHTKLTLSTHSISGTRTVWLPSSDTTHAGVSGVASISASTASAPILQPCTRNHKTELQSLLEIPYLDHQTLIRVARKCYWPGSCRRRTDCLRAARDPGSSPSCRTWGANWSAAKQRENTLQCFQQIWAFATSELLV